MSNKIIIYGGLALVAGYATAAIVRQGQLAADTAIEYAGYQVLGISAQRAEVKLDMKVINKSSIKFQIFNQAYDVSINGIKVATVSEFKTVTIPGNGSSVASLLVEFNPKETIPTLWAQLIGNMGNANIRLKGKISVRSLGILVGRIPVDTTFTLKNFKVE